MRQRIFILLLLVAVPLVGLLAERAAVGALPAVRPLSEFFAWPMDDISKEDVLAAKYWTMLDENGRELLITGRRIHVGDEFISGDNRLYRVVRINNRTAHSRFVREVGAVFSEQRESIFVAWLDRLGFSGYPAQPAAENEDVEPTAAPRGLIGIYHTHNAEAYIPSDGDAFVVPKGGIHGVGRVFAENLEEKGVRVVFDQTLHLPHDRGAYRRSRVTTERLLAKGPDVIFDVHRDAAPRHVYATQIDGEWVTQVKFVVGRQNPNMQVTRQFALDLKRITDQVHPNLIKGIFMARGNYNQDLTPFNLLLEVGAHTNSREAAKKGIALFADAVAFYFYGPEGERAAPAPGALAEPGNRSALRSILFLLGGTAAIVVGFILLNSGRFGNLQTALDPWLGKARSRLEQGDRYLLPWQEKIRSGSQTMRDKLLKVSSRVRRK
ncbi:MAG: stage II sporulation protein P [Dethiobacter sp.]|jgi:stage II sporulation protein P|nr:stage II sporulation protein P [Dethiobacter sp.]MBS3901574.1 stage II sporulation protein P [Dethiobacter sp.]MBS3989404.1 stage II sporulation protein P [Dethiobacter sp.]